MKSTLDDGSDSNHQVSTITAGQQAAWIAAPLSATSQGLVQAEGEEPIGEVSQAIYQDWGCNPSSLWIFDNYNTTGNMLCLAGSGTASLASYCRYWAGQYCSGTWIDAMRSYYGSVSYASSYTAWQPGSCGQCTIPIPRDTPSNVYGACFYSATVTNCP